MIELSEFIGERDRAPADFASAHDPCLEIDNRRIISTAFTAKGLHLPQIDLDVHSIIAKASRSTSETGLQIHQSYLLSVAEFLFSVTSHMHVLRVVVTAISSTTKGRPFQYIGMP